MDGVEDTESVPHLIQYVCANELANFDSIGEIESFSHQIQPDGSMFVCNSAREPEVAASPPDLRKVHSVSISMPPSPAGRHFNNPKQVLFCDHDPNLSANNLNDTPRSTPPEPSPAIQAKFYSQPTPRGAMHLQSKNPVNFPKSPHQQQERGSPQPQSGTETPQPLSGRDGRFDSLKTWSGKLERQVTRLSGRPLEPRSSLKRSHRIDRDALPVDRYFDALEGPELDTLRPQEESILPDDKSWPFLLRYTIASFGICLGIGSQAILWKTLATSMSTKFLHISLKVNLILWIISVALMVAVSFLYILKLIFYFEAVRREYYHPIRINFFFAPWIALLFLCLGVPPSVAKTLPQALWYVLMAPIFCLELKIYGQWMSGGTRRLSKVANPSNHLSIVGNFVGALLGASMGLKEGPLFFFAVGLAHYIVMFVTLYQRLPTNETLPNDLHPVFFLFVAAPSVASMAWANIQGSFDYGSRIAYFIGIFLYLSLAVRLNFFRGFRFSLAWWAYTFPMTGAAIATIRYSNEVRGWFTRALAIVLCTVSVVMVLALLVATFIHAFVKRNLFPNDNAIAVSDKPPISVRKWFHHNEDGPRDPDDIENYLKFVTSNDKAAEEPADRNDVATEASSDSRSIDG